MRKSGRAAHREARCDRGQIANGGAAVDRERCVRLDAAAPGHAFRDNRWREVDDDARARCTYEQRLLFIVFDPDFGIIADGWSLNPQRRPLLGCVCEAHINALNYIL